MEQALPRFDLSSRAILLSNGSPISCSEYPDLGNPVETGEFEVEVHDLLPQLPVAAESLGHGLGVG